ncbi:MAG: flippase-like domain-containing protein, partial [Candidatus Krumholzibacteria bacterium]|nr:flippase-like domain-containing protein [Candidatus Krumholzibacteria bacterium]
GLRVLSTVSLTVFSLVVLLVLLSLANPDLAGRAVRSAARRTPWLGRRLEASGTLDRVLDLAHRYHDLMTGFLLREKLVVAGGILLSVVIYFNKFAIAYVVLRGLGIDAPFWDVIYMQVVLMLIFYFSPTPGASGLAEVSTAAVMGSLVPLTYQSAFIVLWRFFTLVAGMIVGAAVLLRYLSRE